MDQKSPPTTSSASKTPASMNLKPPAKPSPKKSPMKKPKPPPAKKSTPKEAAAKKPVAKKAATKSPRAKRSDLNDDTMLVFDKWLDESGQYFVDFVPAGKGAIDLTSYNTPSTALKPTFANVQSLDNQDFDDLFQKNLKQASKYFNEALGTLNKGQYKIEQAACDTPMEKLNLWCLNNSKIKLAKQEAALAQVRTIKYLAWHPETTVRGNPLRNNDGTLKGRYVCRYNDENNEQVDVDVSTDWAQANFSLIALAYAQQTAYQAKKIVEVSKDTGSSDILSGFIDCERENFFLQLTTGRFIF
jgi:hypothetical protein